MEKFKICFLLLILSLILVGISKALTCSIKSSCDANEQCIFSTYQANDTHAGNCSAYTNKYCCSDPFLTSTSVKEFCGIGEFSILAFYNYTDAHAETFNNSVLELRFEENFGDLTFDSSGKGNHGKIYGASWTDGKYGKALSFDGVGDYVEISHSNTLVPVSDGFTFSFWLNLKSYVSPGAIITKRTSTSNGYFIFIYTGNAIHFDWGGSGYRWNTGYVPPLNTWTFIALVQNSSGRFLYVNGFLTSSTTNKGDTSLATTTATLRIFADSSAFQYFNNGTIDEVRIYNRALTEEEIKSLYYQYRVCVSCPWVCEVKNSCSAGEFNITSVYQLTNTHLADPTYYNLKLCCKREDLAPLYSSQSQNNSNPTWGEAVLLSAYWKDNGNLSYAILATNETGTWENKTTYGSPLWLNHFQKWSNFTWQNSSVPSGTTVAWKIYANDSCGNWNVTQEQTFQVTKKVITVCKSGSCDFTEIQPAINYAQNGDTILIIDGSWYNENVVLNKSLTLTSNSSVKPAINSSSTSLNITANGATVTNLTIMYNGTATSRHVVWITGNYTTLANNTITMRNQNSNYPIYIQNSANNLIYGNNITSRSYGSHAIYIYGSASTNNTIEKNLISYGVTSTYAIYIGANNNTIKSNNITSLGGYLPIYMDAYYSTVVIEDNYVNGKPIVYNKSLQNLTVSDINYGQLILANSFNITINNSYFTEAGILFVRVTNSTIINSNITTKTSAIWFVDNSHYNTIFNNNISTSGGDRSYGIVLSSGNYINITNNNITITGGYNNIAIEMSSSSDNNTIDSNTIKTSANYPAIVIYSGSDNHKIINTNISNTNSGTNAAGIRIEGANINITYCNITTVASSTATYDSGTCTNIPSAICIRNANNTRIRDSILNALNYYDIFVSGNSGQINYLINTSFNKTDIMFNISSNSTLYNQYYLDVKVQNSTSPLQNANVTAWDKFGTKVFSLLTNSSGLISTQILTEFLANYTYNSTNGYYYFTNYTLNTSLTGYITDSRK
ncbi:MAG: LamG-like jellyroll fold domain-containing protein, partial [Candidatus Aenigmatarchaeota archaeon]